jgi:hypothetical protein
MRLIVGEEALGELGQQAAAGSPAAGGGQRALDQLRCAVADHRHDLGQGQRPQAFVGQHPVQRRAQVLSAVDQRAVQVEHHRLDHRPLPP